MFCYELPLTHKTKVAVLQSDAHSSSRRNASQHASQRTRSQSKYHKLQDKLLAGTYNTFTTIMAYSIFDTLVRNSYNPFVSNK